MNPKPSKEILDSLTEIFYKKKESDRKIVSTRWCSTRGYVKESTEKPLNLCDDPECPECKYHLNLLQEVVKSSKL